MVSQSSGGNIAAGREGLLCWHLNLVLQLRADLLGKHGHGGMTSRVLASGPLPMQIGLSGPCVAMDPGPVSWGHFLFRASRAVFFRISSHDWLTTNPIWRPRALYNRGLAAYYSRRAGPRSTCPVFFSFQILVFILFIIFILLQTLFSVLVIYGVLASQYMVSTFSNISELF